MGTATILVALAGILPASFPRAPNSEVPDLSLSASFDV
jgi:hypothetical protein